MIRKNLARRLERLEESLLPVLEEPVVIKVIYVSLDGQEVDSGIEYRIPAVRSRSRRGGGEGHRQAVAA